MRRRMLASVGGKALPYLRRVAYLKATGTQFLNPQVQLEFPVKLNARHKFETGNPTGGGIIAIYKNSSSRNIYLACSRANGYLGYRLDENNVYTRYYADRETLFREVEVFMDQGDQYMIIDGEISASSSLVSNKPIIVGSPYIFAVNEVGNPSPSIFAHMSVSYITLQINEKKILDLIPVLDLSGRPAMYDKVSGQLFYNQGTGEFIWGELDAASNAPSQLGGGITAYA